jgi:hypothetical protein
MEKMMNTVNCILHIKNMVCPRCKYVVKQICEELGYTVLAIELGQVVIKSQEPVAEQLKLCLEEQGFQLLDSDHECLVERVKVLLIDLLYWNGGIKQPVNLAEILEMGTQTRFDKLELIFYSACGCTIQEYFDLLRFERAKELVSYHQHVQCITESLGYAACERLELEFRRRLNMDLSAFIASKNNYRISLDALV